MSIGLPSTSPLVRLEVQLTAVEEVSPDPTAGLEIVLEEVIRGEPDERSRALRRTAPASRR